MNFLNKKTNKYSKIINESRESQNDLRQQPPHITDCQIPKPCKDTYVFKDEKDTLIIKNTANTFEYTQFDKHNHLMEIATINKNIIAKFSLEIVENSVGIPDNILYDCLIQSKDCIILDINDLPYEPAIALYNFIYLHTQSESEMNSEPVEIKKSRKKVTFSDKVVFPNTPTSEISSPDDDIQIKDSRHLKQAQLN